MLIAWAFGLSAAQSAKPTPSPQRSPETRVDSQNRIVDPVFPSTDLARLPVKSFGPRLTLQRALKIAERYARTERFSGSSYFLSEARLIQYGGDKTPREMRWLFHWASAKGPPFEITVSMSGKPSRAPSM
jgi:hypothetical protein